MDTVLVKTQPSSLTVASALVETAFEGVYPVAIRRQSVGAVKFLFLGLDLITLLICESRTVLVCWRRLTKMYVPG